MSTVTTTRVPEEVVPGAAGPRRAGPRGTHRTLGGWFADTGWRHVVVILALCFALFPVAIVISASLTPGGGLDTAGILPKNPGLGNYRTLLSAPGHPPYWNWFFNSVYIGGFTAIATVFLCACAAFAFSRLRFKGRRPGLLTLLLIQMFPALLAFVALFLLLDRIKKVFPTVGLGTSWGLILVYLGGALGVNTWLMKGFFDTIPYDLDESAKVDGATHAETYFRIILPLAAPVLAVIGLLSYVATQSEYLLASIILPKQGSGATLAVGLSSYVNAGFDKNWGAFAAGALIGAIPVVLLFLFLQRFIVSGLTAGAVKG
jgi:arabinogalactan oligomer/maltooligosaccharide transport system permease protein